MTSVIITLKETTRLIIFGRQEDLDTIKAHVNTIAQKIDINSTDLLHFAAMTGNLEVLDLLLAHKDINPNVLNLYDGGRHTTAHTLLRSLRQENAIKLIKHPRFDPNVLDSHGQTIMSYIIKFKFEHVLAALIGTGKAITLTKKEIVDIAKDIHAKIGGERWRELLHKVRVQQPVPDLDIELRQLARLNRIEQAEKVQMTNKRIARDTRLTLAKKQKLH